jgi:hypothetical protein
MASVREEGLFTASCERGFGTHPRRMEGEDIPAAKPTLFRKTWVCDYLIQFLKRVSIHCTLFHIPEYG